MRVRARDAREGAGHRRGQVGRGNELVEAHEVGLVHELLHALAEGVAGGALAQQRRDGHDRAADDSPTVDAQGLERLGQKRDDLGLGCRTLAADELDAHLRELARLPLERLLLAHDRRAVAKAHGQGARADATRR